MQGRKPAGAGSLFNVKNDPGETLNLSEQFPNKVRELRQLMQAYMKEFNANTRLIGRVDGVEETAPETPKKRKRKKKE